MCGTGQTGVQTPGNQNRLMKGFANKLLKSDGSVDLEGGTKFLAEYKRRFAIDEEEVEPYSPEMPLESDRDALQENALNWLCGELQIPVEERADFKNYGKAVLDFWPEPNRNATFEDWGTYRPDGTPRQFVRGKSGTGGILYEEGCLAPYAAGEGIRGPESGRHS